MRGSVVQHGPVSVAGIVLVGGLLLAALLLPPIALVVLVLVTVLAAEASSLLLEAPDVAIAATPGPQPSAPRGPPAA